MQPADGGPIKCENRTINLIKLQPNMAKQTMKKQFDVPEKIRVSVGSAIVLELLKGKLDAPPTTIYMLTYRQGKCQANCGFCPQARSSNSRADMLARVTWPVFPTAQVIERISALPQESDVKRVCIQALNYPKVFEHILHLAKAIHSRSHLSISISCQPLDKAQMEKLKEASADRVSIALDAATEELFDKVKGPAALSPYTWTGQQKALKEAVEVFGENQVYTHLIAGLGETEKQITETIQWCKNSGIYPSLFAFTPIPGTTLENNREPNLEAYRRIQLARHLIVNGKTRLENLKFDEKGRITDFGVAKTQLKRLILEGRPFRTSGCPECNRPYYNERPSGPMYNYPRQPTADELSQIEKQLEL